MLDELPSLEFAATAVAVVLVLRASLLSRAGAGLFRRRARSESGRARDLIGIILIGGAVLYVFAEGRASTWFLVASGLAIVAQLFGVLARSGARVEGSDKANTEADDGAEDDEELHGCPSCGHGTLIELDEGRLLAGLNQLTPVTAAVCPRCGALSGQVEDPAKIPVGEGHGTSLRKSLSGEDADALEEPAEHDG